jgi:hypothetical protein
MTSLADFSEASYTKKSIPGFVIDNELSGTDQVVYRNGNKAVVAFTGTRPNDKENRFRDLTTDLGLWSGMKSHLNRFKNTLDVTTRAINKYGKDNVYVTGHSLGGSEAVYANQKLGVQGSAYNPFIDQQDVLRSRGNYVKDNFHVHTILGDPVSLGSVNLIDQPSNVHIHTPISKYANIIEPLIHPNPLAEVPYVGEALAVIGALTTAKKVMKLHDIGNFTGTGTYANKLTENESITNDAKPVANTPIYTAHEYKMKFNRPVQ